MNAPTHRTPDRVRFLGRDDDIDALLRDLRLAQAAYCRSELTHPWTLDLDAQEGIRFHYVAEGGCWLGTAAADPVWLGTGDIALVAHDPAHRLSGGRDAAAGRGFAFQKCQLGADLYRLRGGGGGARSVIVCCRIVFAEPRPDPLVALLPPVLLVRAAESSGQAIGALLKLMAAELVTERPGATAVMNRLADVVLTQLLRDWFGRSGGLLPRPAAAVADPGIAAALAAIHRQPGRAWKVPELAALADASRSSFAERFTRSVGVPPARYLAGWRMRTAMAWLRRGDCTVAQIARQLGYDSEGAFSRAFKRAWGEAPGRLRRAARPETRSAEERRTLPAE